MISLAAAFLLGALTWHLFGAALFNKAMKTTGARADVLRRLDTQRLVKLKHSVDDELEHRRHLLKELYHQ